VVRAGHPPQRTGARVELIEVGGELDPACTDPVVGMPAGLEELQHPSGALGDGD
jgi:hypothetical protein